MKLHVIYNPNRWLYNAKAGSQEVRVHRAGCRDIAKEKRGATSDYTTEGETQREIAEDFWADFIAEESMAAEDAMNYTDFLPCTNGLPEDAEPVPAVTKADAKRDLSRVVLLVVEEALKGTDESNLFRGALSADEAAQLVSNWLGHLPAGSEDGKRWWPASLPRPTTKRGWA